jgi:uncharacterized cysteine cluster protein YcgN (CxxCxxCC family)
MDSKKQLRAQKQLSEYLKAHHTWLPSVCKWVAVPMSEGLPAFHQLSSSAKLNTLLLVTMTMDDSS